MQRICAVPNVMVPVLAAAVLTAALSAQNTRPEPKAQPGPVSMTECEGTNNCATWTFLGTQGNGQWPNGQVANLTVENFDSASVVIRRADSTGATAGLTALYKGTRHDNRIGGEFTSSWPGHWDNKVGNWYATIEKSSATPPSVMHWCADSCRTWIWVDGHYQVAGDAAASQIVTVESWTPASVVMRRTDTGPYPGTAVLTGKISGDGNSIDNGTITWTYHPCCGLTSRTFNAAWGTAINKLPGGDPPPSAVVVRPVVCYAWFFGLVCGR